MHLNFCHFFFWNSVWTFTDIVRSPYSQTRARRMELEEHHTLTTAEQKLGRGSVQRRWMVRALQVHHSVICRQVVLSYCILQVCVFENEHVKEHKYHSLVVYIALHLYHVLHKWVAFMDQQCIIQYSNSPYWQNRTSDESSYLRNGMPLFLEKNCYFLCLHFFSLIVRVVHAHCGRFANYELSDSLWPHGL